MKRRKSKKTVAHRGQLLVVPDNLICNMRAPNLDLWLEWKDWVKFCNDKGRDVCYLTLSLCRAAMTGETVTITDATQVVKINMKNVFTYAVKKPRRVPHSLSCVKPMYQRTFSSSLFDAYVLQKARDLNREFCFRDFLELKHDAFRRIVRRLIRKGKIIANPQRTIPRWYFLAEKLPDYLPKP